MTIRGRVHLVAAVLAVALMAGVGCAESSAPSAGQGKATVPTATAGSGADTGTGGGASGASVGASLVASKCTRCHSIDRIRKARKSRAGWTKTVSRMQSNGLQVSEGERAAIVEYLTLRDGGF